MNRRDFFRGAFAKGAALAVGGASATGAVASMPARQPILVRFATANEVNTGFEPMTFIDSVGAIMPRNADEEAALREALA